MKVLKSLFHGLATFIIVAAIGSSVILFWQTSNTVCKPGQDDNKFIATTSQYMERTASLFRQISTDPSIAVNPEWRTQVQSAAVTYQSRVANMDLSPLLDSARTDAIYIASESINAALNLSTLNPSAANKNAENIAYTTETLRSKIDTYNKLCRKE